MIWYNDNLVIMELSFSIKQSTLNKGRELLLRNPQSWLVVLAALLATGVSIWSIWTGYAIAYGDSESHLNIAKRVVDSLSPGFAQLGGIWLPLPHVLMLPFVVFDPLWRSGAAGAIVSGLAFVISVLYIYKLTLLLIEKKSAGIVAALVFMANPNILYMQSTPMSELVLICFFVLSTYFFIRFLKRDNDLLSLLLAGLFGFLATLSRYDGWFLVMIEAFVVGLVYFPWKQVPRRLSQFRLLFDKQKWQNLEGKLILYCTLAFFGILLWLLWDWLILGDPLYFLHSEFSAGTQQAEWRSRGALPAYHNLWLAFLYYFTTAMSNIGVFVTGIAITGLVMFSRKQQDSQKWFVLLVLMVPFIFNVLTLFLGQSVIFIPHLTKNFEWNLFNVRYGLLMVPAAALLVGYAFYRSKMAGRLLLIALCMGQIGLFVIGYSKVIDYADGVSGLSSAISKLPSVQGWIKTNYDGGLVLVDDYARTMSIIRSGIPMDKVIYIGNRGYWDDSLKAPEKYARWIVMQKNDMLWKQLYDDLGMRGRVYKYFEKAYTSPDILVFKRTDKATEPGDEIPSTIPELVKK